MKLLNSAIVAKAAIDNIPKERAQQYSNKVLFIKTGSGLLGLQAIVCWPLLYSIQGKYTAIFSEYFFFLHTSLCSWRYCHFPNTKKKFKFKKFKNSRKFKVMSDIYVFSHTEIIAKSCYPFCPPFGLYFSLSQLEKIILTNLCCKVLHFNYSVLTWFCHISPTVSSFFPDMRNSSHVLWYIYCIAIVQSGCN